MTDDQKPVNEASRTLFAMEAERFRIEGERHKQQMATIAEMACRVDGVDAQAFRINLDTMAYIPRLDAQRVADG